MWLWRIASSSWRHAFSFLEELSAESACDRGKLRIGYHPKMLYRAAGISRKLAPWAGVPTTTPLKGRIEDFMSDQYVDAAPSSFPDATRLARTGNTSKSSVSAVGAQSTIGKTLLIKGEISGSESVHIEGKVEGAIALPGDRVTVGRNGRVSASIAAQDIVVLGEVLGNCNASDHLAIRCDGSLYGDIVVSRISVEEGAYLTGSIDIRREPAPALKVDEDELVESLHVN